ncbi:MAG: polysaccharide biosynthesis tyrosine autokinase [bacterium]
MKKMLGKVYKGRRNGGELENVIQIEELAHKDTALKRRGLSFWRDRKKKKNPDNHNLNNHNLDNDNLDNDNLYNGNLINGNHNNHNLSNLLVTLWEPYSMASEQYRELRTRMLDASQRDGKRVFLISSALSGEGKTLVAINLAISLASGLHETALLIDADLRNPNVSRVLGLEKEREGLAEYLTYGANLADFITKTSIHKLNVITSGQPPENPSELISSVYMSDLIKEVKHRYDNRFIIIDAPPLLPVTDSVVLSSLVDSVIIVVKALSTQREMVSNAIDKIEKKEKILGLVVNCCKGKTPYPYYNDQKDKS